MWTFVFFFYLLNIGTTFAAVSPLDQSRLEEQVTMQDNILSFVQSLQLVPSQNLYLINQLESYRKGNGSTTVSEIDLACQVAQACLGPGSVETGSVNQTDADANWSVIPHCSELLNANISVEGLKHVGQRHRAYYFHNRLQRLPRLSILSPFLESNSLSVAAVTHRIPAGPVSTTKVFLSTCRG